MKRFSAFWTSLAMGRNDAVLSVRILAVLSFLMVSGAFVFRGFHHNSIGDFCGGAAVSFSGILMMQLFQLRSANFKNDPDESKLTELHLSR
jgi:hypothetical protein